MRALSQLRRKGGVETLILPRSFYERDTLEVARDLVGAHLHRRLPKELGGQMLVGQITETEGYLGTSDDAAHTHRGKTKRNQVMFGPGGYAYVYFIYGMYWNMNVVTQRIGISYADTRHEPWRFIDADLRKK